MFQIRGTRVLMKMFMFSVAVVSLVSSKKDKADDCCEDDKKTKWILVMNYANFDAEAYGDASTTQCQCRQACLNLPGGCTGYDWFPAGTTTKCWIGNNCPVTLTFDTNNQHYIPTKQKKCYDKKLTEVRWKLMKHGANYDAPAYGDNTTTHCQCRQQCIDTPGCTGYDWYPYGSGTHCWVGNNCPVQLTEDKKNEHYVPVSQLDCYPGSSSASKDDD